MPVPAVVEEDDEVDQVSKQPKRPSDVLEQRSVPTGNRRMTPEERKRQIAEEAVRFFAELGFDGQTRELARRLKITQPLLYRYFPSKEALIERVYQDVFLERWNPEWDSWIKDREGPVKERFTRFYLDYARVVLSYEWVRLFLFAGLKNVDISERSANEVMERIYPSIIGELRWAYGCPPLEELPMTDVEIKRVQVLHGEIFYLGIRRWIYHAPFSNDDQEAVASLVAEFIDGAPSMAQTITAATAQLQNGQASLRV